MNCWIKRRMFETRTSHFSTTLFKARAWFSASRGVLQTEVIQNSPQRQVSWLKGQNIFPHACDPPTSTRQFSDSANRKAASISLLGCFARFKWVSRIVAFELVVNRQPMIFDRNSIYSRILSRNQLLKPAIACKLMTQKKNPAEAGFCHKATRAKWGDQPMCKPPLTEKSAPVA